MFIHSIKYIIDKLSIFVRKKCCEYKTCVKGGTYTLFHMPNKTGGSKIWPPFSAGSFF